MAAAFRPVLVVAVLALALLLLGGAPPALPAQDDAVLPEGFVRQEIPTGLPPFQLTNFAVLTDGTFLVTGKSGMVRHVSPEGTSRLVAHLEVDDRGDVGLVGIALANDYADSGLLYLAYNHLDAAGQSYARLSRWEVDDPATPTSLRRESVVLDGITSTHPYHSIGTVLVDPTDDTLWVGIGDGYTPGFPEPDSGSLRAQRLDNPYGKILHLLPNGDGVPANPFYDAARPASWRSRTYAVGLRNPFRFDFASDGRMLMGDVGWGQREELNVGVPGANYGWPCYEGSVRPGIYEARQDPECVLLYTGESPHTPPLWEYDHTDQIGQSITGGTFISNDTYPAAYQGAYFFGDYVSQKVWTALIRPDGTGFARPPEPGDPITSRAAFATSMGGPVAFHQGIQGDLHIADIYTNSIWRLRYAPGNRPPTARASAEYDVGSPSVTFTGSRSSDPDGDAITFEWDFGDGSDLVTDPDATHTYAAVQTYHATLTVTDEHGASDSVDVLVALDDHPPSLQLITPPEDTTFAVGDVIRLEASAADPEDGDLDPDTIEWSTILDHCPTPSTCHLHPGPTGTGPTFEVEFTDHGDDTTFEIEARVRDSLGQTSSAVYRARPRLRTLSVTSDPPGVPIDLNGVSSASRPSVQVAAGSRNTLRAPARYGDYVFGSWSNGQSSQHALTMPDHDLPLIATYRFEPVPEDPEEPEEPEEQVDIRRLNGASRMETAIAVSRSAHEHADVVILARADDYADALSGGPLAARFDGPILLTGRDDLHRATASEISRLDAREVVILGGRAAVSDRVAAQLGDLGVEVRRIAGHDRFETAAHVASELGGVEALVVEGVHESDQRGWPDAVAASTLAALTERPIVLTASGSLPEASRRALADRDHVTIVGGPAAVSSQVEADIAELVPGVSRVFGRTRYETSAAMVGLMRAQGADPARLWLATGRGWPDVLTAAPAAAKDRAALLLVDGSDLAGSPPARQLLSDEQATLGVVRLVGGTSAVSAAVEHTVREILAPR